MPNENPAPGILLGAIYTEADEGLIPALMADDVIRAKSKASRALRLIELLNYLALPREESEQAYASIMAKLQASSYTPGFGRLLDQASDMLGGEE